MAIDPELKRAILDLPEKEKVKLLLKLIGKDALLMKQLHYQLIQGAESLDERRNEVTKKIDTKLDYLKGITEKHPSYLSPGILLMWMRDLSGFVNEHVLVTKDKLADVELRLQILNRGCELLPDALTEPTRRNKTLIPYIAGRMKFILSKYNSLHEDYQYDLKESMNKMLSLVHHSAVSALADAYGFPKQV